MYYWMFAIGNDRSVLYWEAQGDKATTAANDNRVIIKLKERGGVWVG